MKRTALFAFILIVALIAVSCGSGGEPKETTADTKQAASGAAMTEEAAPRSDAGTQSEPQTDGTADTETNAETDSTLDDDIVGTWEMAATGGIIARMTFREDGKIINEDVQLGTYTADGDEIKVYYTIFDGLTPFVFTLEDDALVYEIGGEETRYERESGAGGDVVGTFVREDENGSTVRIAFESDGSASCTTVTPPNRAYSVEGGKLIITTSDQTIGGEADIVISGNTMTMTVLGKDMVFTRVSD